MSSVHGTITESPTTEFTVPADAITVDTALEDVLTDSLDVVECPPAPRWSSPAAAW